MPVTAESISHRVECPICAGRGTARGRAPRAGVANAYRCGLCDGAGFVRRSQIQLLEPLREKMQRVADLMQVGDSDGAAAASRTAAHLARLMLRRGDP